MRPRVIMHTQVSLNGCIRGFQETLTYYMLAAQLNADTVLFGSETVLKAAEQCPPETESAFQKPKEDPDDKRPLWVIPDSRGRLKNLHVFRNTEYCRDIIVLVSLKTPIEHLEYLERRNYSFVIAGNDHVDYARALETLYERFGSRVIRTDSGGALTNVLIEQGLVDEISLVVSPCLAGTGYTSVFRTLTLDKRVDLKLISAEPVNEELALRYEVC